MVNIVSGGHYRELAPPSISIYTNKAAYKAVSKTGQAATRSSIELDNILQGISEIDFEK